MRHDLACRIVQITCAMFLLKADYEIVFKAVSQNGMALQYASAALRANYKVVKEAVSQEGSALQYSPQFADPALVADRDIVFTAVSRSGAALRYAHAAFQMDQEVASRAVHNCLRLCICNRYVVTTACSQVKEFGCK
eukprot:1806072-Amphidinium_carterae.1